MSCCCIHCQKVSSLTSKRSDNFFNFYNFYNLRKLSYLLRFFIHFICWAARKNLAPETHVDWISGAKLEGFARRGKKKVVYKVM